MPKNYDIFDGITPDKGYIVNSEDGYKYIKKGTIDIGGSWDNYYDIQGVTDNDGVTYPVLGWSDYVGSRSYINTRSWIDSGGSEEGESISGYTTNEEKKLKGMEISEQTLETIGGIDVIKNTRNKNSIFFKDYGEWGNVVSEFMFNTISPEMNNFRKNFGPFRHAVNKAIFEFSSEDNMKMLAEEYKKTYNSLLSQNNDTTLSQSTALKTVFMPHLMSKLEKENVVIPGWFQDGNIQEAWIDYNLGITNPELNREALMFHNDGFSRIIDSFKDYVEEGEYNMTRSEAPWTNSITPQDYMDPYIYTEKMASFINSNLNKLTKGLLPKDEITFDAQKNLVTSILMQDMMKQTRVMGDITSSLGMLPPAAWWLIGTKDSPRFLKALKDPYLRSLLPNGFKYKVKYTDYDIGKFKELTKGKNPTLRKALLNTINQNIFGNMADMEDDILRTTEFKDRRLTFNWKRMFDGTSIKGKYTGNVKIPVSKLYWGYRAGTDGFNLVSDIVEGALSGYGVLDTTWSPKSKIGKDFFDALDIWEGDPGERNWYGYEGQWEQAWFLEDNFLGASQMLGYEPFARDKDTYTKINTDANKIFNGISQAIVDGYNHSIETRTSLNEIGMQIHDSIVNSPEYSSLLTDELKKDYYIDKWEEIALYQSEFKDNDFKTKSFGVNAKIKNGLYRDILKDYVIAHNTYEGGLSLINRLRTGNDTEVLLARDVPPPPGFPKELWVKLKDELNENDNGYDIFSMVGTNFGSIYNTDYLKDVDGLIDEWIDEVTLAKEIKQKHKIKTNVNTNVKNEEIKYRRKERDGLRKIMQSPVSTRVDIDNFLNESLYLTNNIFGTVLKDLDKSHFKIDKKNIKSKQTKKKGEHLFDF